MTPAPSFTMPSASTPAPAGADPSASLSAANAASDQHQLASAQPSASTHRLDNAPAEMGGGGTSTRSEPMPAQPKHCARCNQLLDPLPPSHDPQPGLPRTPPSASMPAPSPSSYAFAPDSLRSQHRLQPGESLTSVIHVAAAVALSRHLDADETIPTDADGHAICTQCAAQLAEPSSTNQAAVTTSAQLAPALAASHTNDTQQSRSAPVGANPLHGAQAEASSASSANSAPHSQTTTPQAQLTISVDNMGAGGDAALAPSADDVHMHGPSAFPPLERAPLSPNGTSRSRSRSRIRFADGTLDQHTDGNAAASSSNSLGRSGSFSRSLSYHESVSSSSAPVVVSFPPSNSTSPISEAVPSTGTYTSAPSLAQTRLRSSSNIHSTGTQGSISLQGAKQRRPSSARRLSRTGSSSGPTTLPFAAVGATSKDDDPYGPGAVTRPRLSLLPTQVIADEIYNSARETRPPSLISSSTSTSLAAASAQHAAGIDPARAVKYHVDPLSFSHTNPVFDKTQTQDDEQGMDVDGEEPHPLTYNYQNLRWFDPLKADPLLELSLLRHPPKSRGCLYPGATFNGTQKSGRNSYDVTVRIVNVDLEASHLCGYLNIRGLTEDWPELTTYFDAEIIGDRYGFVTGKWGATEADDLKHWARFAPFRPLRSALSKPGLRFDHLNKGFVFMRWKEKFLVPDHRVRDINGASFAGFYYVCVELGESVRDGGGRGRSGSNVSMGSGSSVSPTLSNAAPTATQVSGQQWYAARTQRRREVSLSAPSPSLISYNNRNLNPASTTNNNIPYYHPIYHPHSPNPLPPSGPGFWPASPTSPHLPLPSASAGGEGDLFSHSWPELEDEEWDDMGAIGKMSGFYFHENSEPYQQLSLHHTPQASSSSFEMR
ncbi:uncharacterized protein UBRO2_04296 [Ustilago bromivora]|uniref:VID24-required for vacuolar import and degradation of Fbp1p n=2 Tax=Ustilago bromivora TaxID=307758 RepID=A0A8H8QPG9_9BASI|nr:uncharacterized protein UBRO2_04296 [Ustilago bromivora]